jgi:hypothetical protein
MVVLAALEAVGAGFSLPMGALAAAEVFRVEAAVLSGVLTAGQATSSLEALAVKAA